MILEKVKTKLVVLVIVLLVGISSLLCFLISRTNQNGKSQEDYWRFRHIEEKVDSVSEGISYEISPKKISKTEIDTLERILSQWGWEYYISNDTNLFIRKYGKENAINYNKNLANELYRRMR